MEKNYPMVLEGENDITYWRIYLFKKANNNVMMVDRQLELKAIVSSSRNINRNNNDTAV